MPLNAQHEICKKYGVLLMPAPDHLKVGIARNVLEGILPLNGLRLKPTADTTGWYIWAGEELSEAPDFFVPLHVSHLGEWCPVVRKFLGLPPGWRFLLSGNYEDVWEDSGLLQAPDESV